MFHRLAFWKTKGMNPGVVYDIGANDGTWTRDSKSVFSNARHEEFEANSEHRRNGLHMVLLGDTEKTVTFYKAIGENVGPNTGASMYLEVSQHYAPGKYITETLPVVPLDSYVSTNNLPLPDFLKLDVQGAELDILRGGEKCLRNSKYVLLEASLHRWNKDAPMIEDIIIFMSERGFQLIDIVENHFVNNYLLQVDILFAHENTNLRCENFNVR